ncbi:MAG: hypothetical protein ACLPV8_04180, partial [Steroidobacteraceae bacterium]
GDWMRGASRLFFRLHAHASHENPGRRRCRFDQALQYPGNADTFEDHRPFGGTTAHYREVALQPRGRYPELAPPRVRALLRGIDHDVGVWPGPGVSSAISSNTNRAPRRTTARIG